MTLYYSRTKCQFHMQGPNIFPCLNSKFATSLVALINLIYTRFAFIPNKQFCSKAKNTS